jgi:hypothetical protein
MTRLPLTMSAELSEDVGGSLAETPSERYDALLQTAISRFDELPINDVAVEMLVELAAEVEYGLNVEALRAGTMLDGAILFAELAVAVSARQ